MEKQYHVFFAIAVAIVVFVVMKIFQYVSTLRKAARISQEHLDTLHNDQQALISNVRYSNYTNIRNLRKAWVNGIDQYIFSNPTTHVSNDQITLMFIEALLGTYVLRSLLYYGNELHLLEKIVDAHKQDFYMYISYQSNQDGLIRVHRNFILKYSDIREQFNNHVWSERPPRAK